MAVNTRKNKYMDQPHPMMDRQTRDERKAKDITTENYSIYCQIVDSKPSTPQKNDLRKRHFT